MSEARKPSKPKRVRFFTGTLACIRGDVTWFVTSLNEELKVVKCPGCGAPNDIKEAKKRA